ncbi:hypothetical protein ACFL6L_00495 [candidate division KSB1 bacterium]
MKRLRKLWYSSVMIAAVLVIDGYFFAISAQNGGLPPGPPPGPASPVPWGSPAFYSALFLIYGILKMWKAKRSD